MKQVRLLLFSLCFLTTIFPKYTFAQAVNLNSNGTIIQITADNGIEWQQETLLFIARGNAKALRGSVSVNASELRAYYRKLPKGTTEVWRIDAIGNVKFKSDENFGYGDYAIYDIDSKILTMTGKALKLVAGNDLITAKKQMEYWEEKQMAVARGSAIAIRDKKEIRANILAAYFKKTPKIGTKIYRVNAFEQVQIITDQDQARANRGVYNVESGIATLTGSVKITRDKNVLKGCSAEINLNTGVSRLLRCPKSNKRVSGAITKKNR